MSNAAAQAMIRFGLGPRYGEAPPADPRGWLLGQLGPTDPTRFADLPDSSSALATYAAFEAAKKAGTDSNRREVIRGMQQAETGAIMQNALDTATPFRERLVWFWANHFTVSMKKGRVKVLAGPFVREAIRPYVTSPFNDMLVAVMRHPAMLCYLDNNISVGPDSQAGQRRHMGLNENLGRESLELHTVTPASGYTQADVTSYSAVLTGWTVQGKGDRPGFEFRPQMHEPGPKVVMGRSYPEGEQGGLQLMRFLSTHPSTYHALATALARHFIADTPPSDAVQRVAAALARSGGNLGAAAAQLVAEPAAWQPLTKLRSPQDYLVAVLRATPPDVRPSKHVVPTLAQLGQPLWTAPLPNGWPDRAADWADPETLLRRADWAFDVAGHAGDLDPQEVARSTLGGLIQPATQQAMQHAGSRREALTLLFTSPEFMRR